MAVKLLKAVCFLVFVISLSACRHYPHVVISTKGGELTLRVEVADTPAKREMGLQYRRDLDDDQGMLFLFPSDGPRAFWMKNTPLYLDMIFIGSHSRIVGIIHQAVPFSTETLSVPAPSQFVLEIKGGLSRGRGIEVGDRVRFENIPLGGIKK